MADLGYTPKTAQELLEEAQTIFKNVFGDSFNIDPASINGLFIQELTNTAVLNEGVKSLLYGSIYNPELAQGVWLYALCKLLGLERKAATSTVVTCTIGGSSGTVVPIASKISNGDGDIFTNATAYTIGAGGTVSGQFTAVDTGAIPANAGDVSNIITAVTGWDTVTNDDAGTLGEVVQSDENLRDERSSLLSKQGSASVGAVYAAVTTATDVNDAYVVDNPTGSSAVIGGVTLIPYSIYIAAIGGTDETVAAAIYSKKCPGIPMNGTTTGTYTDPVTANTFDYKFQRPTETAVTVIATIKNSTSYPATIEDDIKAAFVADFASVKIGETINVSRFYAVLIGLGVKEIESVTIDGSYSVLLDIDKIATLSTGDITVVIN